MNIYMIVGIVAIVFIGYLLFLNVMMKKRKQNQLKKFQENYSGQPLNDSQKRVLAHGAILAYSREENVHSMLPDDRLDQYVYGLKNQWEITNKEEAFQVLDDLTDLKKSSKINEVLPELENDKEFNKRISKIAKELKIPADDVKRINDTFAWDTCRAINLAKWCFWTGYLTEKEAWDYMLRSSEIAMERCDNWQDYTLSFLIGRTIQGFDLDDMLIYSGHLLTGKFEESSVYQEVSFK